MPQLLIDNCSLLIVICGRGGIGIRATLRSLWGKTRGSSNLLDRTSLRSYELRPAGQPAAGVLDEDR